MAKVKSQEQLQEEQLEKSLDNFRKTKVQPEELLARLNKASWEKMYYYVEGINLMPEYEKAVEAAQKRRDELDKQIAEQQAAFQAANTGLREPVDIKPDNITSIEDVLPKEEIPEEVEG